MVCVALGKDKGCPTFPPCHPLAAQGENEPGSVLVLSLRDWVEGNVPHSLCEMLLPWSLSVPSGP